MGKRANLNTYHLTWQTHLFYMSVPTSQQASQGQRPCLVNFCSNKLCRRHSLKGLHSPFRKCEPRVNNGKELNMLYDGLRKSTWETSEGCRSQEILRKDTGLNGSSEEWEN